MAKLSSLAKLIRSKNAGPFMLTFDIMFNDRANYERVKASGQISEKLIAHLYGVPVDDVQLFFVDNAVAVKASIPRKVYQGDLGDPDNHGGQQYAPLMDIEI